MTRIYGFSSTPLLWPVHPRSTHQHLLLGIYTTSTLTGRIDNLFNILVCCFSRFLAQHGDQHARPDSGSSEWVFMTVNALTRPH